MRVNLWKFSSGLLLTLLAAVVFVMGSSPADAQSNTRSFQLSLWNYQPTNPVTMSPAIRDANADIPTFWGFEAQPAAGPSIWLSYPTTTADPTSYPPLTSIGPPTITGPIDWSRIVAVEFDEPYASVDAGLFTPDSPPFNGTNYTIANCATPDSATLANIAAIDAVLSARATELEALAPKARFWVNLDSAEAFWIATCNVSPFNASPSVFNRSYIDVISFDASNVYIDAYIGPASTLVRSSPPTGDEHQQLALIPGVFSEPQTQLSYLPGYFNFANNLNQSCNLPLGNRGVTGYFDGCPVWIVVGWLAPDFTDPNTHIQYLGILNANSVQIKTTWDQELAIPLVPALAQQRTPAQIIQPIVQLLLLDN